MAMTSPSTPNFTASFCCTRTGSTHFLRTSTLPFHKTSPPPTTRRLSLTSRVHSSIPSNGFVSPDNNGDLQDEELQHGGVSIHNRRRRGSLVFVTLPVDVLSFPAGSMRRKKAMAASFRALAMAGVEGVVMEVWWGLVEREEPKVYNWGGYLEIVALAKWCGLKVRAVMGFHQCGSKPTDPSCLLLLHLVSVNSLPPDLNSPIPKTSA